MAQDAQETDHFLSGLNTRYKKSFETWHNFREMFMWQKVELKWSKSDDQGDSCLVFISRSLSDCMTYLWRPTSKNKSLSWAGLVILVVHEPLESLLKETGQEAVIWTQQQQLLLVRVADTKLARQIQVEVRQYTQFAPGACEIDSASYCWRGME